MIAEKMCCCRNIDCRHQIIFCIRFQISNMFSWWASQAARSSTTSDHFHEYFKPIYWIYTKTFTSKREKILFHASMLRLLGCLAVIEIIFVIIFISIFESNNKLHFDCCFETSSYIFLFNNLPFAFFQSPNRVF